MRRMHVRLSLVRAQKVQALMDNAAMALVLVVKEAAQEATEKG